MDEIKAAEITTEHLIQVRQLPIIEERLQTMKARIQQATTEALALACTPETIQTVKEARRDLNREFEALEAQRKAVKAAVLGPYEQFEAVYRDCVSAPLREADVALKGKISEVECGIVDAARNELRPYFDELRASYHLPEWVTWDRMGLKISLTEAKSKKLLKLRGSIAAYLLGIAEDIKAASQMEHADEILVEYERTGVLSSAVTSVSERFRRLEEEKKRRAEWEAQQEAERKAVERVEAVAPPVVAAPVPVEAPAPAAPEKVFKLRFAITGTKKELVDFKKMLIAYCKERNLSYE